MRRNSGVIGPLSSVEKFESSSGVFDVFDNYNYRLVDKWPPVKKFLSTTITPSTTITEGNTVTCTVSLEGFPDDSTIYYTINTTSGTTMTGADFIDGLVQGSANVSNNQAVINKTLAASDGTENNQFQFQIRSGSVSGTIELTSDTITVTDFVAPVGQANFLTNGSFTWTAPSNVTSVCVVAIGGGGGGISYSCCSYAMMGGGGGGLGWKNNITVSPGTSYTVVVGAAGQAGNYSTGATIGGQSYFISSSTVSGNGGQPGRYNSSRAGGTYVGDGGGDGGSSVIVSYYYGPGSGGGAGGYSGDGGNGRQSIYSTGYSTPSGGGGGGGCGTGSTYSVKAYGGGGVGVLGQGSSGSTASSTHPGGYGGSGGGDGWQGGNNTQWGGNYGGGGGGSTNGYGTSGDGGRGAVRIIWGAGRSYPSTLTTDQ